MDEADPRIQLDVMVSQTRALDGVDPMAIIRLRAGEGITADVRLVGGLVLHSLHDAITNVYTEYDDSYTSHVIQGEPRRGVILTSTAQEYEDYENVSLDATHPMSPVQPHDDETSSDNHMRWLQYRELTQPPGHILPKDAQISLSTTTATEPQELNYHEYGWTVELPSTSSISLQTLVWNEGRQTVYTSLGQRSYVSLPVEGRCTIDGVDVDQAIGEDGAYQRIAQGEARRVPGFKGVAALGLPDGRIIGISTEAYDMHTERPATDLVLWRKPGIPILGVDTTIGCAHADQQPYISTTRLDIAPHEMASLKTTFTLIE